jgi:hypothetical protein
MAVHGADLQRESQAWQSSLLDRFTAISDYGVVNPSTDFLVAVRGGVDPLELYLTPGTCYPPSGEKIYIPEANTDGATEGVSFWLTPPNDATLASDPHLLDPTTGASLLLGDPLQTNLVWVIYWPTSSRPTVLENNTTTNSEWDEGFVIMVSPLGASKAQVPTFFWNNINRAVCVGVVSATSPTQITSSNIDLTQVSVPYNRPQFSGRDDYARKKIQDFRMLLDTYPNAYVERRSSAVGNVYGDVYTETYFYDDVYQDDLMGSVTSQPGTFYVKCTHFPKFIVSSIDSTGQDMSQSVGIVSRKKYLTVALTGNQTTPIAQGDQLSVTYSYYNVAEGYLNKSTNPDSVTVAQPLDNEMVLIEGTAYTDIANDTCIPSTDAQYPATYTFFLNGSGNLDYKPRMVFGAVDLRRYVAGTTLAVSTQVTTPTKVLCYLTGPPGIAPGTNGVTFSLMGLDANGNSLTDTVIVNSTSATEIKPGLGNNGTDWVGYYSPSNQVFSSLLGCSLSDGDATSGVTSGSNKDFSAFVLSAEDIDLRQDLPNCKVIMNAAGDSQDWTFEDLRDDYLFQSLLSLISSCKQVSILNGTIMAWLPAGEPISQYDICYIKPGQTGVSNQNVNTGYLYRAIAANDAYKPNVVGVAQSAIAQGEYGWVLLRGIVINGNWSFLPGVLYLSGQEPGKFSQGYPFQYASTNQDQMQITFSNGGLTPYIHIQIGSGHFYCPNQPGSAPSGLSFGWDVDTTIVAQNFAQVVSAWSASALGVTGTAIQASVSGSTVTLLGQNGLKNVQVNIIQDGSSDSPQTVVTQTTEIAALAVGVLEGGGSCTPNTGDGFVLNGTALSYGTDWTDVNSLASAINRTSGGSITAQSAGSNIVNLTSTQSFTVSSQQAVVPGYGVSCLSVTGQTFQQSANLTVSPELLPYKPTVRCGYAITSSKVLFDGPIFSKKYAAELFVEDTLKQYASNQAEGCLVEIPKFIVLCRRPEIIPLAGAAPIFIDDDSATGTNRMFVWIQGFVGDTAVICVAIKRYNTGSTDTGLKWYLSPGGDNGYQGAITFRILPDCAGEISGFKNQSYPDKLGNLIGDTGNSNGNGYMTLKAMTTNGKLTLNPSDLIKNPYATAAPPDESFPNEASGTYYDDPTYTAFDYQGTNGGDAIEWVDNKTMQLGFRDATLGNGGRFYVSGYNRMTLIEMSIGPKAATPRVKFFALGWERINFFGLEGDKVRFYVTPRCSEPWIYDAALSSSDSGVAPAANTPRDCQVLGTSTTPRICQQWG